MNTSETAVSLRDTTANPAPLGLLGFGMTTVLLNLHNAGLYELNSMIIGMGIFVGGIAQIIAGIQEWKKNNTFGATAFTAYGSFWIALVAIWLIPRTHMGEGLKSDEVSMGWFLLMWGHIHSIYVHWHAQVKQGLTDCFWISGNPVSSAGRCRFYGIKTIKVIAGFEGIFWVYLQSMHVQHRS